MVAVDTVLPCVDVVTKEKERVESQKETVEILSPKVIELRSKIYDEDYMNNAIARIAQVISRNLVESPESLKLSS